MAWQLEVSVKLDNDEMGTHEVWEEVTQTMVTLVGEGLVTDSGTGMGARDMQVQYATQAQAEAARERFKDSTLDVIYLGVVERRSV